MQGVISPMTPCTPTVTAPRLVSGAAHSQTCEVLDADHCYEPLHTPFRACPACSAQGAVIYPSLRKRLQREEQISDGIAALHSGACWTHLSGDGVKGPGWCPVDAVLPIALLFAMGE